MATLSKPIGLDISNIGYEHQYLTRYQVQRIRQTFPFLSLPAEMRNIIYELSINVSGIENYFDKIYARIKNKRRDSKIGLPRLRIRTPTVFLICRQIFSEAVGLLSKHSLSFDHGLLDLTDVSLVATEQMLRNLSSITITNKGHSMLQRNILVSSWSGYMDIIVQLSNILSSGHRLKNFTINLDDQGLALHTEGCWDSNNKCDFRDHIKEAFDHLRKIRNVPCVTLTGIPDSLARELKARMESKPKLFVDLPGEIKNQIYELCADPSDLNAQLMRTMSDWQDRKQPPPYPKRTTPTILLLNKTIYKEAVSIIRRKTLNITFPLDQSMQTLAEIPNMLGFISGKTLSHFEHVSIKVESWEWVYSLDHLLLALSRKHNLKSFSFYLKDHLKTQFVATLTKKYPDQTLHLCLGNLAKIRGVEKVTIEGDLPEVYSKPMVEIMQTSANSTDTLPTIQAVRGNGEVVDADADDE